MRKMFSKNQIKEIIANNPSEILEAISNQDVQVKTIEQSETSWDGNLTYDSGVPAGLTLTPIYNKATILNNVLHLVLCFRLDNESGSTVTIPAANLMRFVTSNVPDKYGAKIIDVEGYNLTSGTNETTIIRVGAAASSYVNGGGASVECAVCEHYNRGLFIGYKNPSAINIANGGNRLFCAEMQIVIL